MHCWTGHVTISLLVNMVHHDWTEEEMEFSFKK